MGETPGPHDDEDEGILGKGIDWSHPKPQQSAERPPDQTVADENNPDIFAVHGINQESNIEGLPGTVLFLKLKIFLRRLQGKPTDIESSAYQMRIDLNLAIETKEQLAGRVRIIPEVRWKEKPTYLTAVLREWESRKEV
jgi:hypothetical protein